jgi:hypothetical protein
LGTEASASGSNPFTSPPTSQVRASPAHIGGAHLVPGPHWGREASRCSAICGPRPTTPTWDDLFELATWEELVALLDENGPDELLRQVRAAEATDPEGRQWPRTKRSDDATAVYLVLSDRASVLWVSG